MKTPPRLVKLRKGGKTKARARAARRHLQKLTAQHAKHLKEQHEQEQHRKRKATLARFVQK
jgi:hypothetical protein